MKNFIYKLVLVFLISIVSSISIYAYDNSDFAIKVRVSADDLNYTVYVDDYHNPYFFSFNVDCEDDGVDEISSRQTSFTCSYQTAGEYTISINGYFPAHRILSADRYKLRSVEHWGTQNWKTMVSAFSNAKNLTFNATDTPDLSDVESMKSMFFGTNFNQDIGHWDVSNVVDMNYMFWQASSFNGDIGNWDVGNVKHMNYMFESARNFNQDIGDWNVSKVKGMRGMFGGARYFNQDIGDWNVSSVENMNDMFSFAISFNQDIGDWNVSSADRMWSMFYGARNFNQDIGRWDVSNVTTMLSMFHGATSFDQDIGDWNIVKVDRLEEMFTNTSLSMHNYDALLKGWSEKNVKKYQNFDVGTNKYCKSEKYKKILEEKYGWLIYDGGKGCEYSENILVPTIIYLLD